MFYHSLHILGLKEHEIIGLRSSINTQLVNLPTHMTEFVVQDVSPDMDLNDNGSSEAN